MSKNVEETALSIMEKSGYVPDKNKSFFGTTFEPVSPENFQKRIMERSSKILGNSQGPDLECDVYPEMDEEEFLRNLNQDLAKNQQPTKAVIAQRKAAVVALQNKALASTRPVEISSDIVESTRRMLEKINKPSLWKRFMRFISRIVNYIESAYIELKN